MRSWVGGEDMVLYRDRVGVSGVALCGYIHSSPYTIPTPDTPHPPNPVLLPIPNPTPQPNPSTQFIIAPTLVPPAPLCPYTAKTLIRPNKAHMSLGRFCCALTIEYKCKTSNINKRLLNSNEQRLNTNVNY